MIAEDNLVVNNKRKLRSDDDDASTSQTETSEVSINTPLSPGKRNPYKMIMD